MPKLRSVAAQSAFRVTRASPAGHPRPTALSYSRFKGDTMEVLCNVKTVSITDEGVYTIVMEEHTKLVKIACNVPNKVVMTPAHAGFPPMPVYGGGLLGIGNSKRALYVSICFSSFASPLSIIF